MKEHLITCAVLLGLIVFIALGAIFPTIVGSIVCGLVMVGFYFLIHFFVMAILWEKKK